jgi:hypothetical protein
VAGLLWLAWGAAALSAGRLLLPRTAAASTLVTVFGVAALVVLTEAARAFWPPSRSSSC